MKKRLLIYFLIVSAVPLFAKGKTDEGDLGSDQPAKTSDAYMQAIQKTEQMVRDPEVSRLAYEYGLQILNLTWEDTGRYYGSSVGPNISDMTIQIQYREGPGNYSLHCMPVIRYPNFEDKTADLEIDRFFILTGNEKGEKLTKVSLKDFLENPGKYMSFPETWEGGPQSLLADRDTHVLVSAQACFLPIPEEGTAEFNPVIFNYQSSQDNPAVLTILCTREGTSMTIIDNTRDAFEAGQTWGQRLFFNNNGERASFTGQRFSDFRKGKDKENDNQSVTIDQNQGKDTEGLNMVLLIQIPLKHESFMNYDFFGGEMLLMEAESSAKSADRSEVEEAVIGHGEVEGPFTETDNLKIERDPDYPIRVTVQFYKATSNGIISPEDIKDIANQIDRVYKDASYVGSLVIDGPSDRPTEYFGPKNEPPDWWDKFWKKHEKNTGMTKEQTIDMLYDLLGPEWLVPQTEEEMRDMVKNLDRK